MASAKVIAAAEALLAALKADTPAAAAPTGNRTTAVTNYRAGSNPVQDVVDCLRRAIRKSEAAPAPAVEAAPATETKGAE